MKSRLYDVAQLFLQNPFIDELEEDFFQYHIQAHSMLLTLPAVDNIMLFFDEIPDQDRVIIDIKMDEGDVTTISSGNEAAYIAECLTILHDEASIKDDDSVFTVSITILKTITDAGNLSIYDFNIFIEYLNSISLAGLLVGFSKVLNGKSAVCFNLLNYKDKFYSDTFIFTNETEDGYCTSNNNKQSLLERANEVRYFLKTSEYPFVPEDFWLKKRSRDPRINIILDKLVLVYSIAYLADIADISENNTFKYRCCGYRTLDGSIDFSNMDSSQAPLFFKIYQWVYTDGNLTDKIGLARNVLTLYANNHNLLDVAEGAFESIKSNYTIYLKQNLQQYIEIKNTVTQLVYEMSQKINGMIDSFLDVFKRNIQWLITFYIGVLLFNTLATGKIQNIFTREIAYISFGFLLISIVLLSVAIIGFNLKIKRVNGQFQEIRKYYADLLDENDLDRIFGGKTIAAGSPRYIKKQMWVYILAWIVIILIMGTVTYVLMVK